MNAGRQAERAEQEISVRSDAWFRAVSKALFRYHLLSAARHKTSLKLFAAGKVRQFQIQADDTLFLQLPTGEQDLLMTAGEEKLQRDRRMQRQKEQHGFRQVL